MITVLVMLSVILTASVLFPGLAAGAILGILGGGTAAGFGIWLALEASRRGRRIPIDRTGRADWRMPPLDALAPPRLSVRDRLWMGVLRLYLLGSGGLVLFRIVHLALGGRA